MSRTLKIIAVVPLLLVMSACSSSPTTSTGTDAGPSLVSQEIAACIAQGAAYYDAGSTVGCAGCPIDEYGYPDCLTEAEFNEFCCVAAYADAGAQE
jgi:hypothetical protein